MIIAGIGEFALETKENILRVEDYEDQYISVKICVGPVCEAIGSYFGHDVVAVYILIYGENEVLSVYLGEDEEAILLQCELSSDEILFIESI